MDKAQFPNPLEGFMQPLNPVGEWADPRRFGILPMPDTRPIVPVLEASQVPNYVLAEPPGQRIALAESQARIFVTQEITPNVAPVRFTPPLRQNELEMLVPLPRLNFRLMKEYDPNG